MDTFSFWKSWPDGHRRWWTVLALLLFVVMGVALFSYFIYPSPAFTWVPLQELQEQELSLHTFPSGGFDFSLLADNYIVFEKWATDRWAVRLYTLDVYFGIFLLALAMLLTVVSLLPRYWYYIGTGVLLFAIGTMQVEGLELALLPGKVSTGAWMLLLLGPGVYFQLLNRYAAFHTRFLSHATGIALICLWIVLGSAVPHPFQYLAVNTLPAAIVLMVIVTVTVAHEIVASFVFLSSQMKSDTGSLRHFLLISAVYFVNLWLTYLGRIGSIDWPYTLPVFWLLLISVVLSVWGIRQRAPQMEGVFQDDILPVYLNLSLGAITFAMLAFFYGTANDVALLAVQDVVLYSHIGYGMMFLVYVISNFMGLMAQNLPVYKVMYKPINMPFFSFRLAGLIFTLGLLFYNRWMVPVNHFISSYYTSFADYYSGADNTVMAQGYYQRAYFYASYNQHAATALARIEQARNNGDKSLIYLHDANGYKPTEFTLTNEAAFAGQQQGPLQEMLSLRGANRLLPNSAVLYNNLGRSFAKLNLTDSAIHYFVKARTDKRLRATADLNLLGTLAVNRTKVDPDSLQSLLGRDARLEANVFALANATWTTTGSTVAIPADSVLNVFTAAATANYMTSKIGNLDTAFLAPYLKLARLDTNRFAKGWILVPAAHYSYAQGRVNQAFQLLQEVISSGEDQGRHNNTLALWCMDQGKPEAAMIHLVYAISQRSAQAPIVNAVALAQVGETDKSIEDWELIALSPDTTLQAMAAGMLKVLKASSSDWTGLTAKEKYQYVRYRVPFQDTVAYQRWATQIPDDDWQARAWMDQAVYLLAQDAPGAAWRALSHLQGRTIRDRQLPEMIRRVEMRIQAARGKLDWLEQAMRDAAPVPYRMTEWYYYQALLQERRKEPDAAVSYTWLGNNNPYFDEGIVAAARFFVRQGNPLKAYHILSEALQVNPRSIRILKAYVPVAQANGFDQFAEGALETLRGLMPARSFEAFRTQNLPAPNP